MSTKPAAVSRSPPSLPGARNPIRRGTSIANLARLVPRDRSQRQVKRARSREQGTGSRGRRTGAREQGTEIRAQAFATSARAAGRAAAAVIETKGIAKGIELKAAGSARAAEAGAIKVAAVGGRNRRIAPRRSIGLPRSPRSSSRSRKPWKTAKSPCARSRTSCSSSIKRRNRRPVKGTLAPHPPSLAKSKPTALESLCPC